MLKLNFSFSWLNSYPLPITLFPSLSHYPSTSSDLLACFCPQELVELINSNRVLVVSGETGCGKTTQVTQFILDDYINRGIGSMCRVVCTQPRRISAISVCTQLDLQVWHLGIFIVVCILRKDVVAKLCSLVISCISYLGFMAIFSSAPNCLFVCVSFLSGSRACSSREGRKCREWKFLWLPNPPAEVRKSFQTTVDA